MKKPARNNPGQALVGNSGARWYRAQAFYSFSVSSGTAENRSATSP